MEFIFFFHNMLPLELISLILSYTNLRILQIARELGIEDIPSDDEVILSSLRYPKITAIKNNRYLGIETKNKTGYLLDTSDGYKFMFIDNYQFVNLDLMNDEPSYIFENKIYEGASVLELKKTKLEPVIIGTDKSLVNTKFVIENDHFFFIDDDMVKYHDRIIFKSDKIIDFSNFYVTYLSGSLYFISTPINSVIVDIEKNIAIELNKNEICVSAMEYEDTIRSIIQNYVTRTIIYRIYLPNKKVLSERILNINYHANEKILDGRILCYSYGSKLCQYDLDTENTYCYDTGIKITYIDYDTGIIIRRSNSGSEYYLERIVL